MTTPTVTVDGGRRTARVGQPPEGSESVAQETKTVDRVGRQRC